MNFKKGDLVKVKYGSCNVHHTWYGAEGRITEINDCRIFVVIKTLGTVCNFDEDCLIKLNKSGHPCTKVFK